MIQFTLLAANQRCKQRHMTKEEIQLEQSDVNDLIVPIIDDDIPLPKSQKEAMPDLSAEQEINVRAETIKTIADIKGDPLEANSEHVQEATKLANEMINNPDLKPDYSKYPNETMAYLAGMVAQSNVKLVNQLADFKLYVLNNAVLAHETAKSVRDKLGALRMIGEVDGVDAFKKKTEVMHVTKTGKELEDELKKAIEELKGKVIEGEILDDKSE